MTIEVSLLLTGLSVAFAIFFGISTKSRNEKKDIQDESKAEAAVMVKLESIQSTMVELKAEVKGYKESVQKVNEQNIRNEESLKSLHKRVDEMEKRLRMNEEQGG